MALGDKLGGVGRARRRSDVEPHHFARDVAAAHFRFRILRQFVSDHRIDRELNGITRVREKLLRRLDEIGLDQTTIPSLRPSPSGTCTPSPRRRALDRTSEATSE